MLNSKLKKILLAIIIIILILNIIFLAYKFILNSNSNKDTIRIGASLPLSGKNAVYGIEIQNAIELAKDEINSRGGINGKKLDIIYEDDQADPAVGTSAIQKLAEVDKVPVVLGSWASGVVVAQAPIAEKNKVIVMAIAIAPTITNAGDYIFRIQPSAVYYTSKSAEFLINNGMNKSAIIFLNNEFGKSLKDSFILDYESRGGKIVAIESYNEGDSDFKTQLIKIKNKNPEVIFIAGYQDTIEIIKQIKELGIKSKIIAGPPFESQSTIENLGKNAEGVIYPYHYIVIEGNERSKNYEKSYQEKYNKTTGGFAPLMYDATYIIANSLKKCDSDSECIKDYLYKTEYNGVSGNITFDENGDPHLPIFIKTVKDGKFVLYNK